MNAFLVPFLQEIRSILLITPTLSKLIEIYLLDILFSILGMHMLNDILVYCEMIIFILLSI
jgi:hypothetical protein